MILYGSDLSLDSPSNLFTKFITRVCLYIKEGYAFGLSLEEWMRVGSSDITFKRPGQGEDFFRDLENSAGYEMRLYTDQALFCMAPGKNVILSGIVNSL